MNWLWAALLGVFLVSTGAASAQQPPTVPVREPVQVAAFAEYRTSVMTMLVRRSRAFRTAATEAITRAAQDARAKMQAPAAETAPAADAPASTPDATTSQP